jgi:hypothetical protein
MNAGEAPEQAELVERHAATRADPAHVMNARWEGDCEVEKTSTGGTSHVAHPVNDNEEVTRTKPSTK